MRRIILASASPRRKELMERAGYEFEVIPAEGEEQVEEGHPAATVEALSRQKAEEVRGRIGADADTIVIGADTVVSIDGEILGKPGDAAKAEEMLARLSGRTHEVYTGVTILGRTSKTFSVCTTVTFYEMTKDEIHAYAASGDPLDKAGAYGIQGPGGIYIKEITGDYNNVVGLPIARLYHELKEFMSAE